MRQTEIVAALGPTNTGKTHRALARMLEHETGILGLPLRLLAREVYDKVLLQVGKQQVALVTGEEKIVPPTARYFICTVEAMPLERQAEFLGVDEIQLAEHPERGHVFTDRLLHARGTHTTWFMGSDSMRPLLTGLVPTAQHATSPRLSTLRAEGSFTLGSLPPRSAVVAFSADRVYEMAEKLKGRKGGAAVVLGALSPRARNAQVALYQEGDVDYLVATDAIGMGLNLDLDRVAFADTEKFDGRERRPLELTEMGQIAGRAGRYQRDGSFGTFLRPPLPGAVQRAISEHRYPAVRTLVWRNSQLDFRSPGDLLASLQQAPRHPSLRLVRDADDTTALRLLSADPELRSLLTEERLRQLWEICQIPDYRKLLPEQHAQLLREIFLELLAQGELSPTFLLPKIEALLVHPGDIESIMARIKGVRTYSYVANQKSWTPPHHGIAARARAVEDQLSDALHHALLARFVERRKVHSFLRDSGDPRRNAKGELNFSQRLLELHSELTGASSAARGAGPRGSLQFADRLRAASPTQFELSPFGEVSFEGERLGSLRAGRTPLEPDLAVEPGLEASLPLELRRRVLDWVVERALGGFLARATASEFGPRRGILYQLREGLGAARAELFAPLYAALSPAEQRSLTSQGLIVGREHAFLRSQLKPHAIAARLPVLRAHYFSKGAPLLPFEALRGSPFEKAGAAGQPTLPRGQLPAELWRLLGYVPLGPRALRMDLYERLLGDADHLPRRELARRAANLTQLKVREAQRVVEELIAP